MMNTPEEYMDAALKEAEIAAKHDEVPVGAVIVHNGEIIARAHNLKEQNQMVAGHAEMIVIQRAEKVLKNWCLDNCDLYVTLEPCMMCAGAISLARIHALYYGTPDPKTGSIQSNIRIRSIPLTGIYPKEIYSGIRQDECSRILKEFFRNKRKQKKQEP